MVITLWPGILIGDNARIAWSLTDTQNQATMFYDRVPAYPYYIGTTANFFDPGYRAATIYAARRNRTAPLTPASFAAIQTSLAGKLAVRVRPDILSALRGASPSSSERAVVQLLGPWYATMAESSAAATIWWTFWDDYLTDAFRRAGQGDRAGPSRLWLARALTCRLR